MERIEAAHHAHNVGLSLQTMSGPCYRGRSTGKPLPAHDLRAPPHNLSNTLWDLTVLRTQAFTARIFATRRCKDIK